VFSTRNQLPLVRTVHGIFRNGPVDFEAMEIVNVGMLVILLGVVCYGVASYLSPDWLLWMAGRCMARRAYILSGRIAHRETLQDWKQRYKPDRMGVHGEAAGD
jgi:hypothetical protein